MLTTSRGAVMDKPMNVEAIVQHASEPFFDPEFSMQQWFRTAQLMLKQANIYEHEGNDQMAYFLLYRYAHLVLDELTRHPHAKDPEYKQAWSEARKAVKNCVAKLEVLKPRINKRYERFEERRKAAAALREARGSSMDGVTSEMGRMSMETQQSRSPSQHGAESPTTRGLDAHEHRHMAVDLANKLMHRRSRREPNPTSPHSSHDGRPTMSLQDIRKQIDAASHQQNSQGKPIIASQTTSYNYHVPQQNTFTPFVKSVSNGTNAPQYSPTYSSSAPSLPPKQNLGPPLPSKTAYTSTYPPTPPSTSSTPPPLTAGSIPEPRQFRTTSTLESGAPLRTIFLPTPLRHAFTRLAAPNTAKNLETCGMLCGTLLQNAFFITRLVIPEQTATSDTCEMINEAALYEYIDGHAESDGTELMVLGWIHTHPTQTCFLSSRDLHTHVWYQLQLAESIAIVCAPSKQPEYGIFRITDPPGMPALRACKQTGIFHPHSESHLYTDALGRPGHVIEHQDLKFEIVDLRPGGANK